MRDRECQGGREGGKEGGMKGGKEGRRGRREGGVKRRRWWGETRLK